MLGTKDKSRKSNMATSRDLAVTLTLLGLLSQAVPCYSQRTGIACSVAVISACGDVVTNFTRTQNLPGILPYPIGNETAMQTLCRDVKPAFERCYEPIHEVCSPYVEGVLRSLLEILNFICSQDSLSNTTAHGQCLMSDDLISRIRTCNDTFTDAKLALNRASLSPSDYMQQGCSLSKALLKCVRYQTWIACGQEASDWLHHLDKVTLNDTIQNYGCGQLDDVEPSGVGWSLLLETSNWWSPLQPQIVRIQGEPSEWIKKAQISSNFTRRSISGDYNKFRFGTMAADYWNNKIVWFNEAHNTMNYIPYWFSGSASTTTVFGAISGTINGMAVDWLAQNIYFSDAGHKWIGMTSYKDDQIGRHKIIAQDNLIAPTGVVTHPYKGYLYWADMGRHVIERSTLSGQARMTLITLSPSSSPIALAMDYRADVLFVLDNATSSIDSYSLDGTNRRRLVEYNRDDYDLIQIDVYQNYIFAAQKRGRMLVFDQRNGTRLTDVPLENDASPIASYGLAVFAADRQYPVDDSCSQNNGGCDQLCITIKGNSPRLGKKCACTLGFVIQPDDHSCASKPLTDNFLLIADNVGRDIYMLDLVNEEIHAVPLNTTDVPFALTYDPFSRKVIWLDGGTNNLRRTSLDRRRDETLFEFGSERVFEIAYDWLNARVYYTDVQYQKVAYVGLNASVRTSRNVLYSQEPTDLALDVRNRIVYWSDWRAGRAKIARGNMDYGNDTKDLIQTGLVLPGGLTVDVDAGLLFWCDAYHSRVEMATVTGNNRTVLVTNSQGAAFFSIAVDELYLYITDVNNRTLRRLHRDTLVLEEYGPPEFQKAIALHLVSATMDGFRSTTSPSLPSTTTMSTSQSTLAGRTTSRITPEPNDTLPTVTTRGTRPSTTRPNRSSPSIATPIPVSTTLTTAQTKTTPTTTVTTTITTTPTTTTTTTTTQPTLPTKIRTKPSRAPTTTPTTTTPTTTATTTPTPTTTITTTITKTPSTTQVTKPTIPTVVSTPSRFTRPDKTKPSRTPPTPPNATTDIEPRAVQSGAQGGLSDGGIAAIVVVMLIIVAVAIVAGVILYRRGAFPARLPFLGRPFERFESEPTDNPHVVVQDVLPLDLNESTA